MPIVTDEILTQWKLDPSGHIAEIRNVAAEHRKAERNMQNLEYLQEKLNGKIDDYGRKIKVAGDELGKASGGASKFFQTMAGLGGLTLGIEGVIGVLGKVKDYFVESFNKGVEYIDKVGNAGTSLANLRSAVDGMVSDMALNRLDQLGQNLGFTEKQMQIVAKAGVEYARVTNGDNAQSVEMLTDKIVSGKGLVPALQKLGIHIDDTGGKSLSQADALQLLAEKFEQVKIKAEDASESWDKMKAAKERYEGLKGASLAEDIEKFGAIGKVTEYYIQKADQYALETGRISQMTNEGLEEQIKKIEVYHTFTSRIRGEENTIITLNKQGVELAQQMNRELEKRERIKSGEAEANANWLQGTLGGGTQLTGEYKAKVAAEQRKAEEAAYQKAKTAKIAAERKRKEEELKHLRESMEVDEAEIREQEQERQAESDRIDAWFKHNEQIIKGAEEAAAKQEIAWLGDYRAAKKLTDLYGIDFKKALNSVGGDVTKLNQKLKEHGDVVGNAEREAKQFAASGLTDLAGGIWSAADAAILGGEGFGTAMSKMLKSTLLSIASQATVRALFETAMAFAEPWAAAQHGTAAAIFGATAALAGTAGLAMSSAGVGSTSAGSSSSSANYSDRYSREAEYTPSSANTAKNDQPLNVNVYIGDANNPGTYLLMQRQTAAQVRKAA